TGSKNRERRMGARDQALGRAELAHSEAATSPAARPIPRKPALQRLISCSHRRGNLPPRALARHARDHPANPHSSCTAGSGPPEFFLVSGGDRRPRLSYCHFITTVTRPRAGLRSPSLGKDLRSAPSLRACGTRKTASAILEQGQTALLFSSGCVQGGPVGPPLAAFSH